MRGGLAMAAAMKGWREYADAVPLPVWMASAVAILALLVGLLLLPGTDDEKAQRAPTPDAVQQQSQTERPAPSDRAASAATEQVAAAETEPARAEADASTGFVLPILDKSDSFMRGELAKLIGEQAVRNWFATDQFLRRFIAITDNVSKGDLLIQQFPFLRLKQPFPVIEHNNKIYMDPAGYRRYDNLVNIVVAIDSELLAKLLRHLSPLMQEAYQELGYPRGSISKVLRKALKRVLKAPVRKRQIRLLHPSVAYRYADSSLERLSLVDRQMLRIGPENTRKLQRKAKEAAKYPLNCCW